MSLIVVLKVHEIKHLIK